MSTTHISEPTEQNAKSKVGQLLETISLRDYFAAKAMQGFCAGLKEGDNIEALPALTYAMADAMLKERNK